MGLLPKLTSEYLDREMTDTFLGYDHRLRISEGELYDSRNLTTEEYPLLSNRRKRGTVRVLTAPAGLAAGDRLCWVDNGTLYYDGEATALTGLSAGDKQLVTMGAYICVFPDKVYYNTADPADRGRMEARYTSTGMVKYRMCRLDGTEYASPAVSPTQPADPVNGALWVDTAQEEHVLRQYSAASGEWTEISTVYTRISFVSQGELPGLFREHDGVTVSGAAADVNGERVICAIGGDGNTPDYIIVPGLLPQSVDQSSGTVKIERTVPEMDYVIECRNRLWGCRFSGSINELYCCALGDFRNWRRYLGESGDSWAASVGAEGEWTGAVNYMGYPTFFKEDRLYRISVSALGAHSVTETVCRGVQKGSGRSLAVVNETLLYKSRNEVCAYQGAFPETVSEALGDVQYRNAVAGAVGDRYYISMQDSTGRASLFVLDMSRGLWMREDELSCSHMARLGDELYALSGNVLYALRGSDGTAEPFVPWMAETGILYYQYPDRKYVSRFSFRLRMEEGAEMSVYIMYDSDGVWHHQGSIRFKGTDSIVLPVRPRRCDHLRIRLVGRGEVRIFSLTKLLTQGSDV